MKARFVVTFEETNEGWSAYSSVPSVVGGLGETKEAALEDWREAMAHWLAYMKETGQEVSIPDTELVSIEVAA